MLHRKQRVLAESGVVHSTFVERMLYVHKKKKMKHLRGKNCQRVHNKTITKTKPAFLSYIYVKFTERKEKKNKNFSRQRQRKRKRDNVCIPFSVLSINFLSIFCYLCSSSPFTFVCNSSDQPQSGRCTFGRNANMKLSPPLSGHSTPKTDC